MKRYVAVLSVLMLAFSLVALASNGSGDWGKAQASNHDVCPEDEEEGWHKEDEINGGSDDLDDEDHEWGTLSWDGDTVSWEIEDGWSLDLCVKAGTQLFEAEVSGDGSELMDYDVSHLSYREVEPERDLTLEPDEGWEGDEVDLEGDNCEFADDVTVTWGDTEIDYTFVDEDLIQVIVPAGQDGDSVTVSVDTFDDCTDQFVYNEPNGNGGGTDDGETDDDGTTDDGTTDDGTTDDDETDVAGRTISRLPGATRIETAIEVSQEMFDSADSVVLARSDLYPDALTGGPFAHSIDAPILLTPPDRLVPQTADEIQRLGANEVILLGLTAALSEDVEDQVGDLPDVATDRIGGPDRFGTAGQIADRLLAETGQESFERAYLAEGAADDDPTRGWPDPIAVSALASHQAEPILLTLESLLPPDTRNALANHDPDIVDIVGGQAAVSTEVVNEASDHTNATFTRELAGDTRFHTSALIADRSVEVGMDPASLWLATGDNWPDGLVAGPTVARDGGVLLLVPRNTFDNAPHSLQWLQDARASLPADTEQIIRILGGEAAISSQVVDELP